MAARKKKPQDDPTTGDGDDVAPHDFPRPSSDQFSLEALLTSEWGFNLVTATPVQRAICRVLDGVPLGDLAAHPDVIESFGGAIPMLEPGEKPHIVVIAWAIRGAKSMICTANAICLSQRPFGIHLMPGDSVRVPIVSTSLDTAKPTFQHLSGAMNSTPFLRSLIVKETADAIIVRHPSGRDVEIKVVALSRAGSTLVGRWMPGVIFDEAPRMGSDSDFVMSLRESVDAVEGRIMPGGTIMMPGSPHKPVGMIFELFEKHFGASSDYCAVVKATGPLVNPTWWTHERCEWMRLHNPKLYRRDVLAEFDDADDSLFSYRSVEAAMKAVAPSGRRAQSTAVLFPASHRNVWTLLALESWLSANHMQSHAVTVAKEWDKVDAKEILATLPPGVTDVIVPEGVSVSMIDQAERAGLSLIPCELDGGTDQLEQALEVRTLLESGRLLLPQDKTLRGDLIKAQRVTTADGGSVVRFPEDDERRRCDYASLLIRAIKWAELPPDETAADDDDMARAIRRVDERSQGDRSDGPLRNIIG